LHAFFTHYIIIEGADVVEMINWSNEAVLGMTLKAKAKPCAFSQALHTQEPKASILANREQLKEALLEEGIESVALVNQVHGDEIVTVDSKQSHLQLDIEELLVADGMVTDCKGVALGIFTADCLPIFCLATDVEAIGAVHAGWRGLKSEIVLKMIKRLQSQYGAKKEMMKIYIGAGIKQCCYEVSKEVAMEFDSSCYRQKDGGYWLDLYCSARQSLAKAGIKSSQITQSNYCSSCDNQKLFSYRKEQGCSGRMLSFIALP